MRTIEVYADIWCPFTHVGVRRLVERRAAANAAVALRLRPWPLELVNGAPMDADFIGEEVDDLRDQVAPDLFTGFRRDRFPTTTLPALALAESAYGRSVEIGETVSLVLRDELFELGHDISDPQVLERVAHEHEIPLPGAAATRTVEASLDEGRARGVVGSPHFFTPSGGFFCPALDITRVDGQLKITSDLERFEQFVTDCFE